MYLQSVPLPAQGGGTVAIAGNGGAAVECFKALRESGYRGEIHLFADGSWPTYNPMLTTYFVAGKIGFERLFPYGSDHSLYDHYGVTAHLGSPVTALDAGKRILANQAGVAISYDSCLVATGASPMLPPIEGIRSGKVFTMRTVEDALRLREAVQAGPGKALVVGASMVGIKLVELFHQAGVRVCLADLADHVFPMAAHPECARLIEGRLRDMGIRLRLGSRIAGIEETERGVRARFEGDGESEDADLLVMCIGVRANVGFVDRNQVEVRQGIVVDERMRASAPGLYAAGDAAQGRDLLSDGKQVIGLWANARYQGRTAGRNMAGAKALLPGSIPHNITHFLGMDFVGIGEVRNYDRVDVEWSGRAFTQLFWREGRLVGANLLDDYLDAGIIKNALVKGLIRGG